MCGILLYISKKKIKLSEFKNSLDLIDHRGPDNSSVFSYQNENFEKIEHSLDNYYNFLIGHKRLAIIDLSSQSNQPFINKNNKNFFLFNGEFYNFKSYSNEETKNSDSLTFFQNLQKNKIPFFDKVIGMWSVIFGKINENSIYLSRDFYGKKPLYYYHDLNGIIIASEFKSIFRIIKNERKVNLQSLSFFMNYKMSPFSNSDETFYENIRSVKPGTVLKYDLKNNRINQIYELNKNIQHSNRDIYNSFKEELSISVQNRLVSDVKIGTFLSGGIDSSLIAAIANKYNKEISYYCAYDTNRSNSSKDDLYYARNVARLLKLNLTEIPIKYNYGEYLEILEKLSLQFEIPVNYAATPFPSYLILQQMKNDGVKVVLDGIGGDEIMGFYPSYLSLAISNFRHSKIKNSLFYFYNHIKNSNKTLFGKNKDFLYLIYKGIFKKSLMDQQKNSRGYDDLIINKDLFNSVRKMSNKGERDKIYKIIDKQLYSINKIGIPFYVGVSDQVSMMYSIENRSPFLDKNLYKYVFIENNYKFNNGFNKILLRKMLSEILSKKIAWRKQKIGFSNFNQINFTQDKNNKEYILDDSFIRSFININKAERLFDEKIDHRSRFIISSLLSIASLSKKYKLYL